MKDLAFFEFFKKRSVKIWSAVIMIVLSVGLLALFAFFVWNDMLYKNQRFTLKEVKVESSGFWNGKKELVCEILRIRPGTTNLFDLDPGALRQRLLRRESSVEDLQIFRVLPDTLHIRIMERTPIAHVYGSVPTLYVDKNCILMLGARSIDIRGSLPSISGLRGVGIYPPGSEIKRFAPAVELIGLVNRAYPQVRLLRISVVREDRLDCIVEYRSVRFRVFMPVKQLHHHMRALLTNLELIRKQNRSERKINLLFKDQAVLSR